LRILGIDPGSINTGYGVIDDGGGCPAHITDGTISTNPSAPLSERLARIFYQMQQIIKEYHPDTAAIEDIFLAKNVKSTAVLSHARGVALLSAADARLNIFEYSPTKIKQSVVGYGLATKEQVQKMVRILLKIEYLPKPDAADALAVAICHMHHYKVNAKLGVKLEV
jgi:crossover junction endodeoxyribonuclease RuvC